MTLQIRTKKIDETLILRLGGELDYHSSWELRPILADLLEIKDLKTLVVNLKKLTLVDSSGLGILLVVAKKMERRSGRTVLVTNPLIRELLDITRLTDTFILATDEKEALANHGKNASA